MQLTLTSVVTLALAAVAVQSSTVPAKRGGESCSTGPVQCCNSVKKKDDPSLTSTYESLGITVQDVTGDVGVTCSPITVVGAGGTSCSGQTVCCSNNTYNGVIAIGCTTININV